MILDLARPVDYGCPGTNNYAGTHVLSVYLVLVPSTCILVITNTSIITGMVDPILVGITCSTYCTVAAGIYVSAY